MVLPARIGLLMVFLCTVYLTDQVRASNNILKLMQKYGERKLEIENQRLMAANNNDNFTGKSQYLVVTMLTRQELENSENWGDMASLESEDRLKFYVNKQMRKTLPETGGSPKHGEIIFLHLDNDATNDLERKLPEENDKKPYLIFFSYYIPCACLSKCNFHCAEEIAHAAWANKDKYITVMGYVDVFVGQKGDDYGTNVDASERFMKEGGVELYKLIERNFHPLHLLPSASDEENTRQVFQMMWHECLTESPVSVCTSNEPKEKSLITTAFINEVTIYCFKQRNNYYGPLTKLSANYLVRCTDMYLKDHVGNECSRNGKSTANIHQMIIDCAQAAVDQSTYVGYPTLGANPDYEPIADNGRWHEAYETSFRQIYERDSFVPIPNCGARTFSVTSYCTKTVKKPKRDKTGQVLTAEIRARYSTIPSSSNNQQNSHAARVRVRDDNNPRERRLS